MLIEILLLLLLAGIPYYLLFEKTNWIKKEHIFLLSGLLLLVGMILEYLFDHVPSTPFIVIALLSSIYTLYQANKTNNLYRLTYYILFFNAPMLILFETRESILYGLSLLISLSGVYLMGRYYERSYGSANYRSVTGMTLVVPYAALILTIYFTSLALYPPFPNSLMFLNGILNSEINTLWYISVVVIFFGNFLIAVRVMAKTVFGKPNSNVHYIDVTAKERIQHLVICILLVILSVVALQELF